MATLRYPALACFVLVTATASGQEARDFADRIQNWAAPPYWSAGDAAESRRHDSDAAGVRAALSPNEALASAPTSPMPFIGIQPCRIADTRNNNFPAGYGPPSMAANVSRDVTLTGQCGIPATARAVSLNVTVTGTLGAGYILIYPKGGGAPGVSTLNYMADQTVANAAIVPLSADGAVTAVAVVSGAQLILDTNGYYGASGTGSANTFVGDGAGNFNMTGDTNTALGAFAFHSNDSGSANTAVGASALAANTTANANTAVGALALSANTSGRFNAVLGANALISNLDGDDNTAVGAGAMGDSKSGSNNTAVGSGSLDSNDSGNDNTGVGVGALSKNTTGSTNAAFGEYALWQSTGSKNIGVGVYAGTNLTSGDNNLYIGNEGIDGESNTIRIGSGGSGFFTAHAKFFAAAVYGANVGFSSAVMVNALGQLGTLTSSARYKEEIHDMGGASDRLLKLRPVSFRYKGEPEAPVQYGLIAEEVEKVMPELVVRSASGEPDAVSYHELPAMLLNEIQKERKVIADLEKRLAALEARLPAPAKE